jgi:hypothetical protein
MATQEQHPLSDALPPSATLLKMITDYWVSQAVSTAAQLGIADFLRDGPKSSEELAPAVGADARALYRLLRALTSVGVFVEDEDSRFGLTPLGAYLQSDVPGSLRAAAIYFGLEENFRAWSHLSYSVQTGQSAFDHVFGMGLFEYLERHPESGRVFNEAMTGLTRQRAAAVVAAYDFSGLRKIVDVGGGQGEFLIPQSPAFSLTSPQLSTARSRPSRRRLSRSAVPSWLGTFSRRCPAAGMPTCSRPSSMTG